MFANDHGPYCRCAFCTAARAVEERAGRQLMKQAGFRIYRRHSALRLAEMIRDGRESELPPDIQERIKAIPQDVLEDLLDDIL